MEAITILTCAFCSFFGFWLASDTNNYYNQKKYYDNLKRELSDVNHKLDILISK